MILLFQCYLIDPVLTSEMIGSSDSRNNPVCVIASKRVSVSFSLIVAT